MSKKANQSNKKPPIQQKPNKQTNARKQSVIAPIQQPKPQQQIKPKTPQPQLIVQTQKQNIQEKQKQQALQRLNQLHQASQETQNKKTTLLLQSILINVQKVIISSKVQFPQESHELSQFLHKRKHKKDQQKNIQLVLSESQLLDKEYKSLLMKKQNILDELRSIQQSQNQIRKNLHDSSILSTSRQRINKMPTLTEQDRQHWLKIKQMVKQHQQNSKLIKQINQKKQEEQKKLQIQLEQKRKRQRSEQKRKVIEKNIEQIKKRHNQRSQQIKESQALVQKLKKKTKLYQKMEQNWLNYQHSLKSQNQAAFFDNYQNKRMINVCELKKFEEQYEIRLQQEQQKRSKKLKQSKISYPAQTFDRTRFSVDILEEAKKMKQLQEEKLNQIKQLISKKKQYATNIKQKFRSVSKPNKIDEKKDEKQDDTKQLKKQMRSMTALDIRNKGNQYMKSINSGLKVRSNSKKEIPKPPQQKHSYKNYLPQVLKKNGSKQQNCNRPSDVQILNSIITKEKASTQEKFYQVQKITKKLQYGGTQKNLLNSINAKIQILKKLSLNNNDVSNK